MRRFLLIISLALTATGIRVPVDNNDELTTQKPTTLTEKNNNLEEENTTPDSYLVPPNEHQVHDLLPGITAPATYLVPPAENQDNYFVPYTGMPIPEWKPSKVNQPINILAQKPIPYSKPLIIKDVTEPSSSEEVHIAFQKPSRILEPPFETSQTLTAVTKKPSIRKSTQHVFQLLPRPEDSNEFYATYGTDQISDNEPMLALHLTPPKMGPATVASKYPTKIYPKKYGQNFRPVPIPLYQFADAKAVIPIAKPLKTFKPVEDSDYPDVKTQYLLQQAEEKRKLKDQDRFQKQQQLDAAVEQTYAKRPNDAEGSETSYGPHGHTGPVQAASPPSAPAAPDANAPPPGERTEFRMHGLNGPHSYQFGYDTGKGKNRQFRYEERDNDGKVKGHYGYMDGDGKLRVVNYGADPETGFHADSPKETP